MAAVSPVVASSVRSSDETDVSAFSSAVFAAATAPAVS